MNLKFKNLKEVIKYLSNLNKGNYYLDYILAEGTTSLEWYKAILKKVKKYNPKRVIDIGSSVNMFGYLFENEGIEYIGIDEDMMTMKPIVTEKIKFINSNYYDVKEQFKNDVIISCLCVGYLIPFEDVLGKILIVDDLKNGKCIAKEIMLKERTETNFEEENK